jgi:hypothetical protein
MVLYSRYIRAWGLMNLDNLDIFTILASPLPKIGQNSLQITIRFGSTMSFKVLEHVNLTGSNIKAKRFDKAFLLKHSDVVGF